MTDKQEKLRTWGICAALAVSVMAFFWGALGCDFISYDDPIYVTSNHAIRNGLDAQSAAWAFTTDVGGNWNPLTWLSHILDVQMYGLKPAGHHLTSLLIHAASSILLFLILKRMTGAVWRAALVAALFALHPLRVESVVWVSERKDVLSTLFWMLTVWMYVRYTEALKVKSARAKWFYALTAAFFTMGLMAKPMLVTLPFVLLLIDYWPLQRGANRKMQIAEWKGLIVEKIPLFALAVVDSLLTVALQRRSGSVVSVNGLTLGEKICNAFISYVRYLEKAVWPLNLGVMYPHPGDWPAWAVVAAVVFLALVTWLVLRRAKTQPYLAVGWFLYLGMLVPVIGIVQAGLQSMADRYTYAPMIGVFIMVVWGVDEWTARHPLARRAAVACGILTVAGCMILTPRQVRFWQNSESLFSHTAAVTDKNYMAYDMLGLALHDKGRLTESMECFQKSLTFNPYYEEALNNMGFALASMGRYREAAADYERALKVKPSMTAAHNNYANALLNLGRANEAIAECKKCLDLDPHFGKAHDNYGVALARLGKTEEAVAHFRDAVSDDPNDYNAHCNLGNALSELGKFDDAVAEYRIALRLNPKYSDGYYNLANVLARQGKTDDAIAELQSVVAMTPDNLGSRVDLGDLLEGKGDLDGAILQFQKATEIQPGTVEIHSKLADALVEKGRLKEALSQFQDIVKITPDDPRARYNFGNILSRTKHLDEALAQFQKVIELKPDYAPAYGKLGAVLMEKNQVDDALAQFKKAVEMTPDNPRAQYDFGYALLEKGNVTEAAAHYPKVFELGPDYVATHPNVQKNLAYIAWVLATSPDASARNGAKAVEIAEQTDRQTQGSNPMVIAALAAGYAEAGHFPDAIATVRRALQLAGAQSDADFTESLQKQLKSYQEGSPYRQPVQP